MLSSARPIDDVTRDNDDFRQSRVFAQRATHRCGIEGLARHDRLALPANDDDREQQEPATRTGDCHVFHLFGGGKTEGVVIQPDGVIWTSSKDFPSSPTRQAQAPEDASKYSV